MAASSSEWRRLGDLYFRKSTGNTYFGNGNNWYVFVNYSNDNKNNAMSGTEPYHTVVINHPPTTGWDSIWEDEVFDIGEQKIIEFCKRNVGSTFMINEPALLQKTGLTVPEYLQQVHDKMMSKGKIMRDAIWLIKKMTPTNQIAGKRRTKHGRKRMRSRKSRRR